MILVKAVNVSRKKQTEMTRAQIFEKCALGSPVFHVNPFTKIEEAQYRIQDFDETGMKMIWSDLVRVVD